MGWGERSCSVKDCKIARIESCNVLCRSYTWDGKTNPDSFDLLTRTQQRIIKKQLAVLEKSK